ncbi:MAG: hypothetical protein NC206_06545 [Bacteroides sp.]|nr:hypothetical protein [Roseburia sp.]MCM1346728.1 hypothetical protein [Bacteroides sp.]
MLTDELISAYMDGNADEAEAMQVIEAMHCDARLREFMEMSQEIDEALYSEYSCKADGSYRLTKDIPMTAVAASDGGSNLCDIQCEHFIMQRKGIHVSDKILAEEAEKNEWLHSEGTPLYHIGRLLKLMNFHVDSRFHCSLSDIDSALEKGHDIIAVVDGGELVGDREKEKFEDMFIGEIPDHAVVVTGHDREKGTVEVHDPQSQSEYNVYPEEQFLDAWADSCNYLVTCEFLGS